MYIFDSVLGCSSRVQIEYILCGESSALGANGRIARRNFFPCRQAEIFLFLPAIAQTSPRNHIFLLYLNPYI